MKRYTAKTLAAGIVMLGLLAGTGGVGAAVLPDDDESGTAPVVVQERTVVRMDEAVDEEQNVKVKVLAKGDGDHVVHWVGSPVKRGFLGVSLNQLSPDLQKHFGAPEGRGVLVGSVVEGSPAEAAGILVGDVLTAIGGEPVGTAADVQRIVREREEGEQLAVALQRNGAPQTVQVTVGVKEMQEFDISLLGDIGDLRKKAFFVSGGMEGGNLVFKTVEGDVTVDVDEQMEDLENVFIEKIGDADDMIYFDTETFKESMKDVHEYLASPEFKERMSSLQTREDELQQRLEELERKLEALEKAHEEQ